jgi:hypothetical protein
MNVTLPFEEATDADFLAHLANCPFRWQGDHGAQVWINELSDASVPVPPAPPTLSAISPSTIAAGTPGATLDLTGTDFVNGSVAVFAGMDLSTTFNSPTSLSAQINPGLLANAATANVAVRNPTGLISANQQFSIT